ncbi:hypothetical protein TrST_g1455 [Triparma strigata]|uniref:Uncharacterized protein n=1 Tax=Triparma strigata TaxID=1606541 RepID=A0A9W6ZKF1_9STRA|nr:hypothetical protein TrST_g1455 [Triparma strigata]
MEAYKSLSEDEYTAPSTFEDEALAIRMQQGELNATKSSEEIRSTGRSTYAAPKIPSFCDEQGTDYGKLGTGAFEMTGQAVASLKDDGKLAAYIQSTMDDEERNDYELAVKLQELEVDRARVETAMANRKKIERSNKFARSSLRR